MARTTGSVGEVTASKVRIAALELFATRGYAAVSMRAIAAEIGIQASALYNHFPTKQLLLVDLLETHMVTLIAAWEEQSRKFQSPVEALEGFVRFHIRYHLDKSNEVFISNMELRNLEPEHFTRIESLRRVYEGFLRKILSIAKQSNQVMVADIPVSAIAIISMLSGVTTWFRSNGRLTSEEIEEIYVAMVLSSVLADGQGRLNSAAA